jgi:hypothetical protein
MSARDLPNKHLNRCAKRGRRGSGGRIKECRRRGPPLCIYGPQDMEGGDLIGRAWIGIMNRRGEFIHVYTLSGFSRHSCQGEIVVLVGVVCVRMGGYHTACWESCAVDWKRWR